MLPQSDKYAHLLCHAAVSDSDEDDEDLDLFGEMTEEEKEAKAKKDEVRALDCA